MAGEEAGVRSLAPPGRIQRSLFCSYITNFWFPFPDLSQIFWPPTHPHHCYTHTHTHTSHLATTLIFTALHSLLDISFPLGIPDSRSPPLVAHIRLCHLPWW